VRESKLQVEKAYVSWTRYLEPNEIAGKKKEEKRKHEELYGVL
jgi:hypothetical protein